jgi:hypothetical protein
MLHIAPGGFDEIGNQIVAALQLDINLRPGVIDLIAKPNQSVVNADHKKSRQNNNDSNND